MTKTALIIAACTAFIALPALAADQPVSAKQAQELSDTVMSPFCPGRTLSGCPSPDARELRSDIEKWLVSGKSVEEVREELVTRYGDGVLGRPRAEGFGLLAWAVPFLFLSAGLVVVAARVAGGRAAKRERPGPADVDRSSFAAVEQEIKNRLLGD